MDACLNCLGFGADQDDEYEPLLPRYRDDTALQASAHEKLRTYQIIRALDHGYMPSTKQLVIHLRCLLAHDVFNMEDPNLSSSGRKLTIQVRQFLKQVITLLKNKNKQDEVQNLLWLLSQVRVGVDVGSLSKRASKCKAKADAYAAYESIRTVGSLLLSNSDFRLFISDLTTLGRQVLQDSATSISNVAQQTCQKIAPSHEAVAALNDSEPGSSQSQAPSTKDLYAELTQVSGTLAEGVSEVIGDAQSSAAEKLASDKVTLSSRLKQAAIKLRKRPDYETSVSNIALLLKRWTLVYSRALDNASSSLNENIHKNEAADNVLQQTWSLFRSFGDSDEWTELEHRYEKLMSHKDKDPELEHFMTEVSDAVQKMFTDPDFIENAEANLDILRTKSRNVGAESDLKPDIDAFWAQLLQTYKSIKDDQDVANLIHTVTRILNLLSPADSYVNSDLVHDVSNVFLPALVSVIQIIPIPRLEVSTPEIDILLENIFLTPGKTVNHSSFLPFRLGFTTLTDYNICKLYTSTVTSSLSTLVTIKLDGLSIRAEDIGFWLRAHKGLARFADSGLATLEFDERGIDIHLDVEIAKKSLDKILTLKAVRVHAHKFNYRLRSSAFSFWAWLFRPILRPILRKVLEHQLASAIGDLLHAANRELVFARERLRATRVADPQDLFTFIKAVAARLAPEDTPDLYTRVGVDEPGRGIFKGKYAPGSLAKVWRDEGIRADERLDEGVEVIGGGKEGWRNKVFDVPVTSLG